MSEQGKWIEWSGGECPVDPGVRVDVRFRDSAQVYRDQPAQFWLWGHGLDRCELADSGDDIIAYRVVSNA